VRILITYKLISQGSVSACSGCGGMFKFCFLAKCLESVCRVFFVTLLCGVVQKSDTPVLMSVRMLITYI